jgi:hypothetical protein
LATQGHARDLDLRAALGNPQDKRHIWQTYSGRNDMKPESQAAPPHTESSEAIVALSAMIRLTGSYAQWMAGSFDVRPVVIGFV